MNTFLLVVETENRIYLKFHIYQYPDQIKQIAFLFCKRRFSRKDF